MTEEVWATDPRLVAEQAGMVAAAWSPPGAPSSWALTAAQFEVLRDDPQLVAIAATIPPDRLPPLLFQAAATFLVLEMEPDPLRDWFPRAGEPQSPLGARFASEYRSFCLDHRDRILELASHHRYQMNEVGRCAGVVPALAPAAGRQIVLVDVGTGAGLALHLDRYRYSFKRAHGDPVTVGDRESAVWIETDVRGDTPPLPEPLPEVVDRVGIDIEPLDLKDPDVRRWLAACIPQEIQAVTRFHRAVEIVMAYPPRMIRGDACDVLPNLIAAIPDGPLICVIDTYVNVFFEADERRRFETLIARAGSNRDLTWISIDPLVPMGTSATHSVLGVAVPHALIERNRRSGVFGVVGRLSYRDGNRCAELLGLAHPGAAWLEWLNPGTAGGKQSPEARGS
jgi:hypothetical protein